MANFEELGVNDTIRKAIDELGFIQPMPVQEAVIPKLLNEGNDIIALAQTGTGKTAAFGLPLLQRIDLSTRQTQAVIMSPTRELCLQISDDLKDFGKYMEGLHVTAVYGGAPIDSQIRALKKGSQVIVATPGRLIDLIERRVADISTATTIVLDEADEMLNMGFADSINAIFEQLTADHRTLLFSATMSKEVEKVAKKYLNNYEEVVVGSRNEGAENVDHTYYMVQARQKYLALKRIVDYYPKIYGIIFCRTKLETQEIADKLIKDGYNAESLHGDLSQPQRDQTMQKFRQHTVQLLVATDVAARGLDVNDLTHVINYGMPDDTESYTHRSGRTGRAGKKGSSIVIIHSREQRKIREVEKIIQKKFIKGALPTPQEICKKQLFRVMDHITKVDVDDETINPFMEEIQRHFEYFDKDDIIKKIVMMEFSKFLEYYADEPDIEEVNESKKGKDKGREGRRRDRDGRDRGPEHRAEAGYTRLFINLGKAEGFYPGEVMQFVNQHVSGRGKGGQGKRQEVGHIDLMSHYCFIEVPEKDAANVIGALDGTTYHGRPVRCNAEGAGKPEGTFNAPVN
nr:DEAD/DEAH box helicase [Prevotella sp.]